MGRISVTNCLALMVLFLLVGFWPVQDALGTGEQIVISRMGEKNPAAWGVLRKYLAEKGYRLSIYEGTADLRTQIENANRINASRAAMLLAMDFRVGERSRVIVAVTDAVQRDGRGRILSMEELPAVHMDESRACAEFLASAFGTKVREFPLFPLLGVDTAGLFISMECTKENTAETLDKFHESLQKCLQRSMR